MQIVEVNGERCKVPLLCIRPESDSGVVSDMITDVLQESESRIIIGQQLSQDSVAANPRNLQPGAKADHSLML